MLRTAALPPYIFLDVTTFTPHIPEKPPATAGGPELCFDSHNIIRSDKEATVPGTDSALVTAVTSTKSLSSACGASPLTGNEPGKM